MDEGEKSGHRGINWGKATHDWREDRRDSMEDRKELKMPSIGTDYWEVKNV